MTISIDRPAVAAPGEPAADPLPLEELGRLYALGALRGARPAAPGSTRLLLVTERGRFVVRPSDPCRTPGQLDAEGALLLRLRARGYPSPRVVRAVDGATWACPNGVPCLVTERIPGRPAAVVSPSQLRLAARALAWFHQEGRGLPEEARPPVRFELGGLLDGADALDGMAPLLEALLDRSGRRRLVAILAPLERGFLRVTDALEGLTDLPRVVSHGSFDRTAVLFQGDRLSGVLDSEEAGQDVRLLDLAGALWAFAYSPGEGGRLPAEAVRAFARAYRDVEPVSDEELALLPAVVRALCLLHVRRQALGFIGHHLVEPRTEVDALALLDLLERETMRTDRLVGQHDRLVDAVST